MIYLIWGFPFKSEPKFIKLVKETNDYQYDFIYIIPVVIDQQ